MTVTLSVFLITNNKQPCHEEFFKKEEDSFQTVTLKSQHLQTNMKSSLIFI